MGDIRTLYKYIEPASRAAVKSEDVYRRDAKKRLVEIRCTDKSRKGTGVSTSLRFPTADRVVRRPNCEWLLGSHLLMIHDRATERYLCPAPLYVVAPKRQISSRTSLTHNLQVINSLGLCLTYILFNVSLEQDRYLGPQFIGIIFVI